MESFIFILIYITISDLGILVKNLHFRESTIINNHKKHSYLSCQLSYFLLYTILHFTFFQKNKNDFGTALLLD